jgi:hypothetical protein
MIVRKKAAVPHMANIKNVFSPVSEGELKSEQSAPWYWLLQSHLKVPPPLSLHWYNPGLPSSIFEFSGIQGQTTHVAVAIFPVDAVEVPLGGCW